MNYYKRHLGDYARDTGHLSALEHGIYCLLLDYYYSTEKPIPKSKAHRIAKANPEETQMVCEEFFKSDGDCWRHSYADRQIAEYNAKADKNRQNGTKGGRPLTQEKPSGLIAENPDKTQSVISGNLSHKPLAISHKEDKKKVAPLLSVTDLVKEGLSEALAQEWLEHRKRKKAPLTERAWHAVKREAAAAGFTLKAAVEKAMEKGWITFEAAYVAGRGFTPAPQQPQQDLISTLDRSVDELGL